ncbi:L-asparaginase-like [Physella acuta]|uniref:L-asparaginase-like n=1 Tax=Physella acuta TaxID=109671 RepID=UPI0027DE3E5B|nr:L-asparaginase-like [Physella acuta]XP_059160301.1 L-asparaginase-like [Physella acuta]XP_059160302.1 L-asparaginase-like [Physella acuta]XP_059160303.1 L-asparaginase-like [Physella acuta]
MATEDGGISRKKVHNGVPMQRNTSLIGKNPKTAKVLVIYTGGTIGMVSQKGAYEPKPNCMIDKLKAMPIFHYTEDTTFLTPEEADQFLVLQPSVKTRRHVIYRVLEFDPLLDSSNMSFCEWVKIADAIKDSYQDYDGFVVLHGTDTMAYTASALSFMCENLGKPIILTGSQIPIFETRSDGRDNFLSSLIIAGTYSIPEVMICFNDKVFRGNRCIKADSSSFSAFTSPNMPPLVTLEIDIKVDHTSIFRPGTTEKFTVSRNMCCNVGLLRLFPGITFQTVRAFLQPPVQGVVLQTYGAGNAPTNRPDILGLLREACNWGVLIVNITQCSIGNVSATYATGLALKEMGVIMGADMTPEAALMKLSYVLGKEEWTIDHKRAMLARNLRGEMTTMLGEQLSITDSELIDSVARYMSLSTSDEISKVKDAIYPCLMCAAAKSGDIPALEKLRASGGDLALQNQDGRTALHVACRKGRINVVHYLLNHGVSIHLKDYRQETALIDAIEGGHIDIIRLLVQTGANLPLPQSVMAVRMCSAAAANDVKSLEAWLAAGASPNLKDYDERTPLHVAVSLNCNEAAELLYRAGAHTDLPDVFGNTAHSLADKIQNVKFLNLISHTENN